MSITKQVMGTQHAYGEFAEYEFRIYLSIPRITRKWNWIGKSKPNPHNKYTMFVVMRSRCLAVELYV